MADTAEAGGDAQITFKVKTSSDRAHTITMPESATVLELKTKLSTEEFESIPVERQRLIYSGRVMKNDDTLATYKIKPNNTIHMVKSAASNPNPPAATSTPTPQAIPSNMASGTANNPLAGLTGARFAGHAHLPGMDMFGPDGGMGPPMDEERLQRLMADPNVQQTMNEALNNPDFVNMLIQSNPMLRNLPNAREIVTSPFMRQMMSNPQMMGQAMRIQRNMRGGGGEGFPAPGTPDNTPEGAAAAAREAATAGQANNPFQSPFGQAPGGRSDFLPIFQHLNAMGYGAPGNGQTGPAPASGQTTTGDQGTAGGESGPGQTPANPFAALFPQLSGAPSANPSLITDEIERVMQMFGAPAAAPSPPDNRPPEERYAEQLRQLNDMGFYDFDRNVAALRRSGGSVQGAVEHLLSATD